MMSDIPRLIKHCLNPEWKTDKIRKHLGDYGEKSEFFKSSIYERVKEIRNNYFHE